jgi:hypothetical protein
MILIDNVKCEYKSKTMYHDYFTLVKYCSDPYFHIDMVFSEIYRVDGQCSSQINNDPLEMRVREGCGKRFTFIKN